MKRALVLFMLLLCVKTASAQRVVVGLSSDSIRVGDPFRVLVRVSVPKGATVVLPDSLPTTEDIENSGKVRTRRDSTSAGVGVLAAYPITAWRADSVALPPIVVVFKSNLGEQRLTIDLPVVPVISVLPPDTAGIEPKPPKDVLGANRVWWPLLLAALLLVALIALAIWWWQRRKRTVGEIEAVPQALPRERALEELERVRQAALVEKGEYKEHYTRVAEVLRRYAATVNPALSTDLTTSELAERVRDDAAVKPALAVLKHSDMVKFARSVPGAADAHADLDRARDWITAYPPPVVEAAHEEKAA
jgi:hypothetical protein